MRQVFSSAAWVEIVLSSWSSGSRMRQKRQLFGLLVLGGDLFAVGGDYYAQYYTAERLNATSGEWEQLPDLMHYRAWAAVYLAF